MPPLETVMPDDGARLDDRRCRRWKRPRPETVAPAEMISTPPSETVVASPVPPATISVPPLSVVELAVPPADTICVPPLPTLVLLALPAAPIIWVPPELMVVPVAPPEASTSCRPPFPIVVADAVADSTSWKPPLSVVPLASPPLSNYLCADDQRGAEGGHRR